MLNSSPYIIFESVIFIFLPIIGYVTFPKISHYRWPLSIFQITYYYWLINTISIQLPSLSPPLSATLNGFYAILMPTLVAIVIGYWVLKNHPSQLAISSSFIYPSFSYKSILIAYALLSVPLQELLFRGIYIPRLMATSLPTPVIIVYSAIVFSLFHLPFKNNLLLLGTFVFGIIWGNNFLQFGTIYPSIISHIMLGLIFIIFSVGPKLQTKL